MVADTSEFRTEQSVDGLQNTPTATDDEKTLELKVGRGVHRSGNG